MGWWDGRGRRRNCQMADRKWWILLGDERNYLAHWSLDCSWRTCMGECGSDPSRAGDLLDGATDNHGCAFGLAGVIWIALAAGVGGWLLAVTGAVALGGVTDEMLLGHWYLVDPRLPRWALRKLDMAAIVALVLDGVVLVLAGAAQDLGVVAWAWLALLALTVLLMVGVWFSIGEQGYNGIMAATGLSYLAVLTALGAVVAGRALIGQVVTQLGRLGL